MRQPSGACGHGSTSARLLAERPWKATQQAYADGLRRNGNNKQPAHALRRQVSSKPQMPIEEWKQRIARNESGGEKTPTH